MVSMILGRLGVSVDLLEFSRWSRILDTSILPWPIIKVINIDIDYKEIGLFVYTLTPLPKNLPETYVPSVSL